ncbi:hypothetical protein Tco_0727244 [Tanacetum coccineum]|uniref:Uncharacterized protein n=1 Tax=Tanacetum coccineum TaxID=301880 RepID=A0ABQ4YK19_9ASTR
MQTQEGMVNEGIALDVGLDSEASTYENTSIEQQDGSNSSSHATDAERTRVEMVVANKENAVVRPSFANSTLTKVHHSNNDTFENVFALETQNHAQIEVENCTKLNREAEQAMTSLTKGLEIFKEKLFPKQTT